MPEIKEKIIVKNLYKIFGNKPQKAMKLLEQGVPKSDIFDRIGQVAGVCDASFSEHEGEIFVVIRLSGSGKSTLPRCQIMTSWRCGALMPLKIKP